MALTIMPYREGHSLAAFRQAYLVGRQDARAQRGWDVFAVEFGLNLRRAREDAGLTQEAVAHRAGVKRYTYQSYEQGKSQSSAPANPTLRTLLALSQVLEMPLNELLPPEAPDLTHR